MTHLNERVDQVFQLIITLDTIFIALVPISSEKSVIFLAMLVATIVSWSYGHVAKNEGFKLTGWMILMSITIFYWLFSHWTDFTHFANSLVFLGLNNPFVFDLWVWVIAFFGVGSIWLVLKMYVYRSVSPWSIFIFLALTFFVTFALAG